MRGQKQFIPRIIREAIDTYPGGLCFSMPDGRPILVNQKMNELVFTLTGHTVLNAKSTWEELNRAADGNECRKPRKLWNGQMVFSFPDGSVWRFLRDTLADRDQTYIQLEAAEVTELYHLSEELYETNCRLRGMYQRQKELLDNIVQINREKELVSAKMRVHDELGQCLIATGNALRDQTLPENAVSLAGEWRDAILSLTSIPLEKLPADGSSEAELLQVAHMIGCQIDFIGERPAGRREQLLLYAAVREALTNAVRHAQADRLTVAVDRSALGYHIKISDNGKARPFSLKEGSGLGNLRERLEREGATLQVNCTEGVTLIVDIPSGTGRRKADGENDERFIG